MIKLVKVMEGNALSEHLMMEVQLKLRRSATSTAGIACSQSFKTAVEQYTYIGVLSLPAYPADSQTLCDTRLSTIHISDPALIRGHAAYVLSEGSLLVSNRNIPP